MRSIRCCPGQSKPQASKIKEPELILLRVTYSVQSASVAIASLVSAALAVDGGEIMSSVQIAMIAGLPHFAMLSSTHPTLAEGLGALFSSEPSTVNVKVDENKIVSDVRDEAHLNARRATRGKYE